jgi:hypothetical protein
MGSVSWTRDGLKLKDELLDSKTVKNWIQEKAQDIVEEKLKTLPAKFFAGKTRARRRIRKELMKDINKSEKFRASVYESLSSLPNVIFDLTQLIEAKKISDLFRIGADFTITACPRGVVFRYYLDKLIEDLSDSTELGRHRSFSDFFLERLAVESENIFFNFKHKVSSDGGRSTVVDINRDYDWNIDGYNGHYYVCFFRWKIDVPAPNKARKLLKNYSRDKIGELKIKLHSLNKAEFDELSKKLARLL